MNEERTLDANTKISAMKIATRIKNEREVREKRTRDKSEEAALVVEALKEEGFDIPTIQNTLEEMGYDWGVIDYLTLSPMQKSEGQPYNVPPHNSETNTDQQPPAE